MSNYPDVDDDNFYKFINKKYARYKIPNEKKTLREICFPTKYELQLPQKFLAEFINPKTPYTGVLVYHEIGSGKTGSAINICEKFIGYKEIVVVLPAFLKSNFRAELRSTHIGNKYITEAERTLLKKYHPSDSEFKEIIKISDARIDKYYTIYSYNKFVDLLMKGELKLRNTLLVIDEIHNMVSETGLYYQVLYDTIHSAPKSLRLVLMSATPIFDKPVEIALTMNLLLDRDKQLPVGQDFVNTFMDITYTNRGPIYDVKNLELFKDYVRGYVSYFRGAPPVSYPRSEINFVKVKMSDKQLRIYRKIIAKEATTSHVGDYVNDDISNNFFIGTRMVSNICFPNNKVGKAGYDSLKDKDLDTPNLWEYSPKFAKILRKIKKATGPVFVYSSFKEFGGIRSFVRVLEHHNFKNYEEHGSGRKRFAIWTGDQSVPLKDEIKNVFNNKNNEDGSQIKVILGSPSIREGVTLLRVQEVHIIDPYWNESRILQVIGRSIRFCSHRDLPYERRLVKVYIYLSVHPSIKISVDQYIMQMAITKRYVKSKFDHALKETAVDCTLFKNANTYPEDEHDIICEV